MKNKHRGELLLLLTSFIWGFAFIAQKLGSDYIEPFTFNFFRNLTAGIFLLAYSFLKKNKSRKKIDSITKTATIRGGIATGLVMAVAVSFQQTGVYFTTSGKAGFITSLYVVIVPIFAIFMGKKVSKKTAISIILALVGLYLLTVRVDDGFSINKGDILIFVGSLFFAFHILFIDKFSLISVIKLVKHISFPHKSSPIPFINEQTLLFKSKICSIIKNEQFIHIPKIIHLKTN